MPKSVKDSKYWQGNRDRIGLLEYTGHSETPAQRRNKNEIARRIENGESATSIYKSLQNEGHGMRKQELLEIAGYVRSRNKPERMTERTYQPEAIRKTPRITKSGEQKIYKPQAHGVMHARGEIRQPFEYIVKIGNMDDPKGEKTKSGRIRKVPIMVTVTSEKRLTEKQIKEKADAINLSTYGCHSRRYAQIRIIGVRIKR